ncbi:MAG TPA: hypothetical protein VK324_11910 [Tepidisphaeraceae bacterium]|nr:hypothetical protein [Tepidisphaeraceae bacterium]
MASYEDRLREFFTRLDAAPAARSFDEGFGQIWRLLNEVEDELSGVAYNSTTLGRDGRLYPPMWDNTMRPPDRPEVWHLRSKNHVSLVGTNGAIEIRSIVPDERVYEKPGDDGLRAGDL